MTPTEENGSKAANGQELKHPVRKQNGNLFKMSALALVLAMIGYIVSPSRQGGQETYALCTPNGKGIYTVDDANSLVECILIHHGTIVDTGDLGEVPFSRTSVQWTFFIN